jgi:hypothetical protein
MSKTEISSRDVAKPSTLGGGGGGVSSYFLGF